MGVFCDRLGKPGVSVRLYQKFQDYLATNLSREGIELDNFYIACTEADMTAALRDNKVNMLMASLATTVAVNKDDELIEPAFVVWRKGIRHYRTVFFTRKDSPVQTIKNLQGKKIAFEKPLSTSGYYLPLSTLLNHNLACVESDVGEAEKDAVRFMFAGTELNQAYWVHSGKVDAGAFNDSDWDVTPKQIRKDLRIIYQTDPVMRWLFSFHKNMPVGLRRKVTAILTGMHEDPNGKLALRDAKNIARIEKFSKQDEMDFQRWKDLLTPLVGLQ